MSCAIRAWFDGVCEPVNPGGHTACGALVEVNSERVFEASHYLGVGPAMSNNCAEYFACFLALEFIASDKCPPGVVTIKGDSKLVINQLLGRWKVNGGRYYPYYVRARDTLLSVLRKYERNVELIWIPRQQNDACDELSKRVLREKGIKFRIQPEAIDGQKRRTGSIR